MINLKLDAFNILNEAINSVKPKVLIPKIIYLNGSTLKIQESVFNLENYNNVFVLGMGKASAAMAIEIEKILKDKITGGAVVTKYKHAEKCERIKIYEAGHPVTDQQGIEATNEIIKIANKVGSKDLVLLLISGGGSALFERLPDQISLEDWQALNEILLKCGADIGEINQIRKSLSLVKGGKFANHLFPAKTIALLISDIPNDDLDLIASGPVSPSKIEFKSIQKILTKYKISDRLPDSVSSLLSNEEYFQVENSQKRIKFFEHISNFVIGTNEYALNRAAEISSDLGFVTEVKNGFLKGSAGEAAKEITVIASKILNNKKPETRCVIFGGETTVDVKGSGLGGRNQELVLSALVEMRNLTGKFFLLSCGTDGTDGPTDAAGAFIDNYTFAKVNRENLNPGIYLNDNDSYNFFEKIDQLIKTGPTGTNVMDIAILLVQD